MAQVVTITVTADDATTTYTVTINTKTVSVLGTGSGDTATAAAIAAALASSTIPEFQEVVWTSALAVITGKAYTAGMPFTAASSYSGGSGTLGAVTQTVASAGPNDWNVAQNWTQGWVPQSVLTAPVAIATLGGSGGSLTNGTEYYYKVTALNQNGESLPSTEVHATASTPDLQIVLTWAAIPGAIGYNVYRTTSSGTYSGSHFLTAAGNVLTYTDTGGVALTAGSPPGSSTAVGDDVYIRGTGVSILYSLNQSTLTLNSLTQDSTFTGQIGLPRYNLTGSYLEYRPRFLAIGIPTLTVGQGSSSGSGMVQIDCGSVESEWNVYSTGQSSQQGVPSLLLVGTNAGNVLNIQQGNVGVAFDLGVVSTVATVNVGFHQSPQTDVTLTLGEGCTLTTINQNGGNVTLSSATTAIVAYDGTTSILGAATAASLDIQGGTVYYQSSGTITAAAVGQGGTLDLSQGDGVTRTITNLTLSPGSTFLDPNKSATFTNPFYFDGASLAKVTIDLGQDFHLQRS